MDRYRVTAPYVLAKAMTQDGPQVKGLYEGALVPEGVSAEWVARHLRKKMIEKLPSPPAPAPQEQGGGQNEEVPPPPPATPPGTGAPQPPPEGGPGSGHKAWIEYAVACGMPREEAAATSRDDLIAAFRKG